MQKKKLTALPIDKNREDVPVMQAVVEFQHTDLWGNNYTSNKYNYVYNAFLDTSTGENTLIVDVFSPAPDAKFCYRLLIGKNKQGNDKWFIIDSKGEVSERSLDGSCYYNKFYYPFSAETDKVIDDYLADTSSYAKGKGIEKIIAWQSAVRQKRLKDKYQKIKDSISYELAELIRTSGLKNLYAQLATLTDKKCECRNNTHMTKITKAVTGERIILKV